MLKYGDDTIPGNLPKLRTSQGWCPYPCTQVSFFGGEDEGGGEGGDPFGE